MKPKGAAGGGRPFRWSQRPDVGHRRGATLPAGRPGGALPPGWSILCLPGRAVPVPFLSLGIPAVAMSRARESRREAGDVVALSLFHRACIIRRR